MIKAVGFQKHIFAGKAQVCALHKIVFVAGVFQDIAKADILREKAGTEAEALPSNGANSGIPHWEATMPAMV
jgi:hypothetical protein